MLKCVLMNSSGLACFGECGFVWIGSRLILVSDSCSTEGIYGGMFLNAVVMMEFTKSVVSTKPEFGSGDGLSMAHLLCFSGLLFGVGGFRFSLARKHGVGALKRCGLGLCIAGKEASSLAPSMVLKTIKALRASGVLCSSGFLKWKFVMFCLESRSGFGSLLYGCSAMWNRVRLLCALCLLLKNI
ncbi:hypothetical protein U1Q18_003416 [Sarracenia purpurea var. burkii]